MLTFARTFFALLLISIAFNANAQLAASFSADATSGCAPLVVHFTNTSTGATSYRWDLDNGTVSYQQDASGTFLTPNTYTVKLTAYNGNDSAVKTMAITTYPVPIVNFTAVDTGVCPGVGMSFNNTTNPVSPGATIYDWNFGDGSASTASNGAHTFSAPGYYNITLVATNANGCVSSLTKPAYIHVYTPPTVAFTANNVYFCQAPGQAIFANPSTGTQNLSFKWSFGDGTTSLDIDPAHSYIADGTYKVVLVATDGHLCRDSLQKPAYIHVGHAAASFTAPATGCVHQPVHFYDNSLIHINTMWNFGDGGASNQDSATHIFTIPGVYSVQLVVFDGSCYDTIAKQITINPAPVANFSSTPSPPCPAPFTLQFNSTAPTATTYLWQFGDGATGTAASPSHTYTKDGADTIRLIVMNSAGCTDTVAQIDTFYNLSVGITANVTGGCIPLNVHFSTYGTTNEPDTLITHPYPYPITYSWNFGDGTAPVTDTALVHTFTTAGTFTVTLTATTAGGCIITKSVKIHTGVPPDPSFTFAPPHICADKTVAFSNTSTNATNYVWSFGDEGGSADTSPVHQYTTPGTYTVKLVAYDNDCADSVIETNIVTVDSPKAIIGTAFDCSPRTQVAFTDISIGVTSFLWIFGDGTTSTEFNPVHNYPSISNYIVALATYNSTTGCRDTTALPIILIQPQISFTANDTAVCKNGIVHFIPAVTGGTAEGYSWSINGLYKDTGSHLIDTFNTTGIYSVELVIKDNFGCRDTAVRDNYITVAKPVDSFSVTPPSGCWPLPVEFSDHSTDVSGVTPVSWQWTFGDGSIATVGMPNTLHTYTAVGTFNVIEIVTDNIGCKDTLAKPALINVFRPTAAFVANKPNTCVGDSILFTNTTAGSLQSSYWIFGDGTTSTEKSPVHAYGQTGNYSVQLIVVDNNGCTDTASYLNYIKITKPDAAFTVSDTFTVCPPLLAHFTNAATGATSYLWDFGNNNTSTVLNPSNDYIASGQYTVMLIAKNAEGCTDTATKQITVYGYAGALVYGPLTGCEPLTVSFSANISQVPTVIWDFSDGNTLTASNGDTVTHTYTIPGAYVPKLILSNNIGCQNSSVGTETIKVDAVNAGYKTIPHPVCVDEIVNFLDTSISYFSPVVLREWTFNDHDTSSLQTFSYYYDTVGKYPVSLIVANANGCRDTLSDSLTVYPLPIITATGDTTVCVGDAAQISGNGGLSYSWSPAATVSCTACQTTGASPSVLTIYTVTGTDINGCRNTDSVKVNVKKYTVATVGPDKAMCPGDSVIITDSGAQTYSWYPATSVSNSSITDPIVFPQATTKYMVVARDGSCIPDTGYVTVTVHPSPTVNAGGDQTIIAGGYAKLEATGTNISRYLWSPAATLSCDACQDPTATPLGTTTYTVTAFSEYNCEDSSNVTIHVLCDKSQVFIPNSFTPNGDGQNDVFYPRGTGISRINSFRIYNRWGEVLFEKTGIDINDAGNAWDGSYKGSPQRPDVYVYVVDAICNTGEPLTLKGDVTIIR